MSPEKRAAIAAEKRVTHLEWMRSRDGVRMSADDALDHFIEAARSLPRERVLAEAINTNRQEHTPPPPRRSRPFFPVAGNESVKKSIEEWWASGSPRRKEAA